MRLPVVQNVALIFFCYYQACYSWTSISEKSNIYLWATSLGVCVDILYWYLNSEIDPFIYFFMYISRAVKKFTWVSFFDDLH